MNKASLVGFGRLQVGDFQALGLLLIVWDNAGVETGRKLGVNHSFLAYTFSHIGLFVLYEYVQKAFLTLITADVHDITFVEVAETAVLVDLIQGFLRIEHAWSSR